MRIPFFYLKHLHCFLNICQDIYIPQKIAYTTLLSMIALNKYLIDDYIREVTMPGQEASSPNKVLS